MVALVLVVARARLERDPRRARRAAPSARRPVVFLFVAMLTHMIEADRSVVLVSNNDHALRQLCDRVVWLDEGRIRADGEPEAVLATYHAATHTSAG